MAHTTIRVADATADRLHDCKRRGESYDDVVVRLLEQAGASPENNKQEA